MPATIAQMKQIKARVEAEFAKPEAEQNQALMRKGIATLRSFKEQSGVTTSPEARAQAFPGTRTDAINHVSRDGNTTITPAQQLRTRALGEEAFNRGQDVVNFLRRPFLSDEEQALEAHDLRQTRAGQKIQLEQDAIASGVDPKALAPAELVGSLLPDIGLAAVSGGVSTARTGMGVLGRVATEAMLGSALGGGTVPLDEDPTNAALLDGGLTLGLGILTETPNLAIDFMRRELKAANNNGVNKNMEEISQSAGIDLSIGERSGVAAVQAAERGVPAPVGGPKTQFQAKRKAQINQAFQKRINQLDPANTPPHLLVERTKDAYSEAISEMASIASANFRDSMTKPLAAVGSRFDANGRIVKGFRFIKPTALINELITQRRLLQRQPLSGTTPQAIDALGREIAMLKKHGLDMGQTQRLLADLSAENRATGVVITDNTRALDILSSRDVQKALNQDLDDISTGAAGLPQEMEEAVNALQTSRTAFGKEREQIQRFNNTAIDSLLGNLDQELTGKAFAEKVLALDARSFNTMLGIADKASPGMGNSIRANVFKQLLDENTFLDKVGSTATRTAKDIDVGSVYERIARMPDSKFEAFVGTGVPKEDAQLMRNTLLTLKAINEGTVQGAGGAGRGMRERIEQFTINLASQNVPFVSRLVAGELSPGAMERLLFTKAGNEALSNLARPKILAPVLAQSVSYIINVMAEDEKAVEELQRQKVLKGLDDPLKMRGL